MSKQDLNNMLLCKWKWHRFKPVGLHVGLYQGHSHVFMHVCVCVAQRNYKHFNWINTTCVLIGPMHLNQ